VKLALWFAAAACTNGARPTATGAECPTDDPLRFGYTAEETPGCTGSAGDCNFGKTFMDRYCINCHHSCLPLSKRNGAPLFHDFDYALGPITGHEHVDQQAAIGPKAHNTFMPVSQCPSTVGGPLDEDCPQPTDDERQNLAVWLACEQTRHHDLYDAGIPDCTP
jgi:hypothetical protein